MQSNMNIFLRFMFYISAFFLFSGEPIFEVIRDVQPDTELVAWFLLAKQQDFVIISHDVCSRSAIYRCTIDSILDGE